MLGFVCQKHGSEKAIFKKPSFLKKAEPIGFFGFIRFTAVLGFWIFLNEQLGSLSVDLAHQLSF